jgi:amino acid adenylation domain-containing protein
MVRSLQEYVTRQAERRSEAAAVVAGDRVVTYGELEARSNRLARLLKKGGCERGDRIALLLPKSAAAIISMLAALKAEGIYVPLDPESPAARLGKILYAAECRYLLAAVSAAPLVEQLMGRLEPDAQPELVWIEGGATARADLPDLGARLTDADAATLSAEPLAYAGGEDDPAHILFTSGSTGTPKGVVVAHRNVLAFVNWANDYFGLAQSDLVSCHSPLHFDLSTYDLYGAFAAGAEVHLVPPETSLFPGQLADFIRERRLTQWFSVPSILAYLARFDAVQPGDFPEMRRLLWCGEVFATPALRYWMERVPHASFTNLYGPTETTIASCYYTVPAPPSNASASVPIGRACGGEELLVLGEDREPRSTGEVGEICIRGAGVTLGYWRDHERTSRSFVQARPSQAAETRDWIYRTGDRGVLGSDGLAYFLGRADSQIKSRGHRIELGEIEAALHTLPEIAQAVVVAPEAPEFGGRTICCVYAPRAGEELSPASVRERLAALVPRYMLPVRWRRMDQLPANANGKVDRVALTDLFRNEAAVGEQQRPEFGAAAMGDSGDREPRWDAAAK